MKTITITLTNKEIESLGSGAYELLNNDDFQPAAKLLFRLLDAIKGVA